MPLLVLLLLAWPAVADLDLPLDPASWSPQPGWIGEGKATAYQHDYAAGEATFRISDAGGTMIWARRYDPPAALDGLRYVTLRYRAQNIDPELPSYLLFLSEASDGRMTSDRLAVGAPDLIADGQWHRLTTQLKIHGALHLAAIRFRALPGEEGFLELSDLRLCHDAPPLTLSETIDWHAGADGSGTPLPIPATTALATLQTDIGLGDWFDAERVVADGLAFGIGRDAAVAVSTPYTEHTDARVPIAPDVSARALHLLVGTQYGPRILTYNGWQPGDRVDSPTRIAFQIDYADGTSERGVPWCLDTAAFGVWRGVHVYELPVADKPLAALTIQDRMSYGGFHLLALTASDARRSPADFPPPPIAAVVPPSRSAAPVAAIAGERAALPCGAGTVTFKLAPQPSVETLTSRVPSFGLAATGGDLFAVSEGDQTWPSSDFVLRGQVQTTADGVTAVYRSELARAEVRLTIHGGDPLTIEGALRNTSDAARTLGLSWPLLRLGRPAGNAALQVAIPRSVLLLTTENRTFRTAYGGGHPLQWTDFHDASAGLWIGTRGTTPRMRWYEAGKERDGTGTFRVDYLPRSHAPQDWVAYPPVAMAIHAGDWHEALRADLAWRATWPDAPAQPEWFRKLWHLRTHWTHTLAGGRADVNWKHPDTGELRGTQMLDKDLAMFGAADYVHLFDWRDTKRFGRWGDYAHYDQELGGLDKFKAAIGAVRARGVRVGLYLDTFLVSTRSEVGRAHGEAWAAKNAQGIVGSGYSSPDDPVMNMAVAHDAWQDYLAATAARVAKETGADGIYLDEGGFELPQYWSYRDDHEYESPGTVLQGEYELFRKVRAALPADKALYTEYCPPDITVPYLTGAYMHAVKYGEVDRSPGYLNLSRFAFPKTKLFLICNGGSTVDGIEDGFGYTLFNGLGLYTLAWGHSDEAVAYLRQVNSLLHEHGEAFNTEHPEPLVPTLAPQVFANRFAGDHEVVYTLWNSGYRTFEGEVLKLPQQAGAKYRDAWHEADLTPRVVDGQAVLSVRLEPRGVGLIVVGRG